MTLEFNKNFDKYGVDVVHFGGGGVYAKQVRVPKGITLPMHKHTFTHLSILAQGSIILRSSKGDTPMVAPSVITVEQGVEHAVHALTDTVWYCLHATDETDFDNIDFTLVGEGDAVL